MSVPLLFLPERMLICSRSTTELFDIIVSFPDTMPALLDLKVRLIQLASIVRVALTGTCRSVS